MRLMYPVKISFMIAVFVSCLMAGCNRRGGNFSPEKSFVVYVEGGSESPLMVVESIRVLRPEATTISEQRLDGMMGLINRSLRSPRPKKYSARGHRLWGNLEELVVVEISINDGSKFIASMGFFKNDMASSISIEDQSIFEDEIYPFVFEK